MAEFDYQNGEQRVAVIIEGGLPLFGAPAAIANAAIRRDPNRQLDVITDPLDAVNGGIRAVDGTPIVLGSVALHADPED